MRRITLCAVAAITAIAGIVYSQKVRTQTVGRTEDGGLVLNTGWRIRPAGKSIPLSTLPMSHALAQDGRMLAVLHGGYAPASVSLVDLETTRESARVIIGDGWRGLAFSSAGDKLLTLRPQLTGCWWSMTSRIKCWWLTRRRAAWCAALRSLATPTACCSAPMEHPSLYQAEVPPK
jgi:hypothetical protein